MRYAFARASRRLSGIRDRREASPFRGTYPSLKRARAVGKKIITKKARQSEPNLIICLYLTSSMNYLKRKLLRFLELIFSYFQG